MKKFILSLIFLFIITGCIPLPQQQIIIVDTPFEKELAQKLLQPGKNTIKVNAFMRQRGGGVVTCAGFPVHLIPATQLARDRISAIYGTLEGGFAPFPLSFPTSRDFFNYDKLIIKKHCNSDGNVVFENVADGQFYVTSMVKWQVQQFGSEGGAVSKLIRVSGGQTLEVILSNVY